MNSLLDTLLDVCETIFEHTSDTAIVVAAGVTSLLICFSVSYFQRSEQVVDSGDLDTSQVAVSDVVTQRVSATKASPIKEEVSWNDTHSAAERMPIRIKVPSNVEDLESFQISATEASLLSEGTQHPITEDVLTQTGILGEVTDLTNETGILAEAYALKVANLPEGTDILTGTDKYTIQFGNHDSTDLPTKAYLIAEMYNGHLAQQNLGIEEVNRNRADLVTKKLVSLKKEMDLLAKEADLYTEEVNLYIKETDFLTNDVFTKTADVLTDLVLFAGKADVVSRISSDIDTGLEASLQHPLVSRSGPYESVEADTIPPFEAASATKESSEVEAIPPTGANVLLQFEVDPSTTESSVVSETEAIPLIEAEVLVTDVEANYPVDVNIFSGEANEPKGTADGIEGLGIVQHSETFSEANKDRVLISELTPATDVALCQFALVADIIAEAMLPKPKNIDADTETDLDESTPDIAPVETQPAKVVQANALPATSNEWDMVAFSRSDSALSTIPIEFIYSCVPQQHCVHQ